MGRDREDERNSDKEDNGVGYGRPPKEHRFPKGQSGNPNGRPKGARGLKTDLKEELASKMTVRIAGKEHTATKQRLALKALTVRAAAGDLKAIAQLVSLMVSVVGIEDEDIGADRLSKHDEKLLAQFLDYAEGSDTGAISSDA